MPHLDLELAEPVLAPIYRPYAADVEVRFQERATSSTACKSFPNVMGIIGLSGLAAKYAASRSSTED